MSSSKKISHIKTSIFSRSISIAKIGLNAGIKYAGHKIANSSFDEFLTSQAESISKEFGELKGSIMKAGQMLSVYGEYFLPPEANQFLKTLQSQSPELEWSTIKKYLTEYLGEELLNELDINPVSVGTASMGQVHSAYIKATGEKIALKIQYPRLENAVDSDVKALRKILSLSKVLPSKLNLDPIFEEIKQMLHEELDYKLEAEKTKKYADLLKNDKRFKVPKVYDRYSNSKVLTTEFLDGLRADHNLIQNLSQERRNQLSENFLELFFKEIYQWNFIQTDPHLGNYKINISDYEQDTIILLDFGAAKKFEEIFINKYRRMIKYSIEGNRFEFVNASSSLGFILETDSKEYVETFINFCYETVEPFWTFEDERNHSSKISLDGTYNWKETDLPKRIVNGAFKFKNFDLRTPPRDIIFLDRKTSGVFIFLAVLRANINGRKIINTYLDMIK